MSSAHFSPLMIVFRSLGMISALFQCIRWSSFRIWLRIFLQVFCSFTFRDSCLKCSFCLSSTFRSSLTWEVVCAVLWFLRFSVWPVLCEVWRLLLLTFLFFFCIPPFFLDISERYVIIAVLFVVVRLVMSLAISEDFVKKYISILTLLFLKILLRYSSCFHLCL
jgi:hypothetical protein